MCHEIASYYPPLLLSLPSRSKSITSVTLSDLFEQIKEIKWV